MLWRINEDFEEFQYFKVLELSADITSVTLVTVTRKDFVQSVGSFFRYYFCYTYYCYVPTKMLELSWKDQ
jgi:hypothetical protein